MTTSLSFYRLDALADTKLALNTELMWLSVWSEVHIVCIWSSWYHCIPKPHHLLRHISPDWFLPCWYRLTQVVLETQSHTHNRLMAFTEVPPYRPGITSMQHAASHTTTIQPSSHNKWYILIGKQWHQLPELIATNYKDTIRSVYTL